MPPWPNHHVFIREHAYTRSAQSIQDHLRGRATSRLQTTILTWARARGFATLQRPHASAHPQQAHLGRAAVGARMDPQQRGPLATCATNASALAAAESVCGEPFAGGCAFVQQERDGYPAHMHSTRTCTTQGAALLDPTCVHNTCTTD